MDLRRPVVAAIAVLPLLALCGCRHYHDVRLYEGPQKPPSEVAFLDVPLSCSGLDPNNHGAWYMGGWEWSVEVVYLTLDDERAWSSRGGAGRVGLSMEILPGRHSLLLEWKETPPGSGDVEDDSGSWLDVLAEDRESGWHDALALGDYVLERDVARDERRERRREAARLWRIAPGASKTLEFEALAGHRYFARWVDDEGGPGDPLLHGYILYIFDEEDGDRPLGLTDSR